MINLQHLDAPKRPFSPLNLSGLKVWLAADRISGLADAGAVGTWSDLSGNGFDFTQATASLKPLYKVNIVNGKPVVRFDGVDDGLSYTGNIINNATDQYTIVLVGAAASTSAGTYNFFASGTTAYSEQMRRTGSDWEMYHKNGGDILVGEAGAVVAGQFEILSHYWEGANTLFRRRGTQKATAGTVTRANAGTVNSLGFDQPDSSVQYGDVDIAEFVIYSPALSVANLHRLEVAWGRKYGIPVA